MTVGPLRNELTRGAPGMGIGMFSRCNVKSRALLVIVAVGLACGFFAVHSSVEGGEPVGSFAITSITADCDGSGLVYFTGAIPDGGLTVTLMTKAPDNSGPFFPAPGVAVLTFTDGPSPLAYQFDLTKFDSKHYRVDSNFNTKSPSLECESTPTPTASATATPEDTATPSSTPSSTVTPDNTLTPTTESNTATPVTNTPTPVNTSTRTTSPTSATGTRTRTPEPDSTDVPPNTPGPSSTASLTSQVLGGEPRQGPPAVTTVLGLPRAGMGMLSDSNYFAVIVLLLIVGAGALGVTLRSTMSKRD